MQIKKKQLLINLSENDYNMLDELSLDSNMSKSEFIKTIIQLIGVTKKIAESDRIPENIQIGGYGITFPMEVMQPFYDNLASAFEKTDWKEIENRINEYITFIQDGTFDDDINIKIQTMLAMLTSIHMNKDSIRNYHLLYYTIILEYLKLLKTNNTEELPITEEKGHELLDGLRKDGYEEWKRNVKINKIKNNLE